jgi:hypothetical protein
MADFFEAIEQWRQEKSGNHDEDDDSGKDPDKNSKDDKDDGLLGLAISSHPATRERIDFFRNAAIATDE